MTKLGSERRYFLKLLCARLARVLEGPEADDFDLDPADLRVLVVVTHRLSRCADEMVAAHAVRLGFRLSNWEFPDPYSNWRLDEVDLEPTACLHNTMVEVVHAMDQRLKLDIAYSDARGNASNRTIWPIELMDYDHVPVLAAWCELCNDWRYFRIDRIQTLQISSDPIPDSPDALVNRWRIAREADTEGSSEF